MGISTYHRAATRLVESKMSLYTCLRTQRYRRRGNRREARWDPIIGRPRMNASRDERGIELATVQIDNLVPSPAGSVRELVGAEGVEPVIDWLRASYSAIELRSRELVPPVGIEPIVGRLSSGCSAVELRGHGGKVRFRSSPYSGSVLQTDCRSHRLSLPGARARG